MADGVIALAGLGPDVTVTRVRSTMAELVAAQKRWSHKLASLFAHYQVAIGLEPQRNAVGVTLSESVPAAQLDALKREASAANVNVFVTVVPGPRLEITPAVAKTSCNPWKANEANCNPSITAGVSIERPEVVWGKGIGKSNSNTTLNGFEPATLTKVLAGDYVEGAGIVAGTRVVEKKETSVTLTKAATATGEAVFEFFTGARCTAGPAAIPKRSRRKRVLLTAGHCIEEPHEAGAKWFAFNRENHDTAIGKAGSFVFGGKMGELKGDYGEIAIEPEPNGTWRTKKINNPVLAVTAEWKKTEEKSYPVKEEREPAAKAMSCHEGQTSGESCGIITKLDEEVTYPGPIVVEGLVRVEEPEAPKEELLVEGGDSGGPFLFVPTENNPNKEALMEGVLSGGQGVAQPFHIAFYQPLKAPAGTVTEGPMEAYELELLTTANERIRPEFESSAKQKFTSKSATIKLATTSESVTCSAATNAGEISGATTVGKLVITFTGCKAKKGEEACTVKSVGGSAKEGELVTKTLKGELGEVEEAEAADEVGLLLEPETTKKILTLASAKCVAETSLEGTMAGEVTPLATSTKTDKLVLAVSTGKQKIKSITVKSGSTTKAVKPELVLAATEATAESTDELGFEKAVEVS